MIKGTNRRMFRRPRPAREASGILASSQELINQVLPLRMENGGDPFAELRKLIEAQSAQTKEPGFRELIRSLGVGALQSEFADPSRGTVENFARALPFGAKSTVHGFNRASRALNELAHEYAGVTTGTYFDDFPMVAVKCAMPSHRVRHESARSVRGVGPEAARGGC